MIEKIWTSPDGKEYTVLPKTWGNTSNINEEWASSHGWTVEEHEVPDPEIVWRYSKYRLHIALGMQDLWDDFWNALDEYQKQLWNDAQELQSNDPFFVAAIAELKEILKIDEDLLEQILEESQI